MRECKTCLNREGKDEMACCAANQLCEAFINLVRTLSFSGKSLPAYECQAYEADFEVLFQVEEAER